MAGDPLLERLKNEIGDDFVPVRPLRSPWMRALAAVPAGLLLMGLAVTAFGLRGDHSQLGGIGTWGLSFAQMLICFLAFTLSLETSIPGRAKDSTVLAGIGFLGISTYLAVSWVTYRISPVFVESGREWHTGLACLSAIVLFGMLPLLLGIFLHRAGLPIRPRASGVLLGLGSGLAAEAAWRLHCPFSSWEHVIPFHAGAILLAAVVGAIYGQLRIRASCREV